MVSYKSLSFPSHMHVAVFFELVEPLLQHLLLTLQRCDVQLQDLLALRVLMRSGESEGERKGEERDREERERETREREVGERDERHEIK